MASGAAPGIGFTILIGLVSVLVTTFATPFLAGLTGLLYVDQRIRRERYDLQLATWAAGRVGAPVGQRGDPDRGVQVLAQRGRGAEPGPLRHPVDRQLGGLQQPPGQRDPLLGEPAHRAHARSPRGSGG